MSIVLLLQSGFYFKHLKDPALVSNYTNYEPYERMKAVNGFIMWPNDTNYIHPADSDDDGAILGYVRHSFYILTPASL